MEKVKIFVCTKPVRLEFYACRFLSKIWKNPINFTILNFFHPLLVNFKSNSGFQQQNWNKNGSCFILLLIYIFFCTQKSQCATFFAQKNFQDVKFCTQKITVYYIFYPQKTSMYFFLHTKIHVVIPFFIHKKCQGITSFLSTFHFHAVQKFPLPKHSRISNANRTQSPQLPFAKGKRRGIETGRKIQLISINCFKLPPIECHYSLCRGNKTDYVKFSLSFLPDRDSYRFWCCWLRNAPTIVVLFGEENGD